MSSLIHRDGQTVRPSFNYTSGSYTDAQLIESARNVLEAIFASQERQENLLISIARTLRRIDRRLAKRIPLK